VSDLVKDLLTELDQAEAAATKEISSASDLSELQTFRGKYLGKKSVIQKISKSISSISAEGRKSLGKEINRIKKELEEAFHKQKENISKASNDGNGLFDPTLPGRALWVGHYHPLTTIFNEIKSIFKQMGFQTAYGPEVEDDWHNFEALNHPPHHPARDMQDTFYISEKTLLRTHTSPVQIRLMKKQKPPIRSIMPGRVYRNEEISARSYCLFHQVEGLCVDEGVSFADLKGTLSIFMQQLFGGKIRTRFRPSFFPFTEPSAEVDVECFLCHGKGCPVCKKNRLVRIRRCRYGSP